MTQYGSKQFKVGVFVIAGISLVIISLFILGGSRSVLIKYVNVNVRFDNVQGLNVGSMVSISGVNAGNVASISFLPSENLLNVAMNIDSRHLSRVTEGSTVDIRTQGALGDRYVFIHPGDPTKPAVKEGAILESVKDGDLMGVISERAGEAGKVFDIIAEVHKLVKSMNDGNRAEHILSNFASASESLSKTAKESQLLVSELRSQNTSKIRSSFEKLDRILTKIDNGEGTLGALINDSSIHDQVKSMVGGSSRKKNMKNLLRNTIEKGSVDRETSSEN